MSIVGELANSIRIINKIVNVIETKHKLKGVLKGFKDCVWCISRNLQELEGMPLSDAAVATFKRLKNVLEETYQIIDSIQKHNSIYLMFKGTRLLEKIKEQQSLITAYMSIITMMNFTNALRLNLERTNTNLQQEQHESADNGTNAVSNSDKREPFSWAQRIKIASGAARALAYLHEIGIIHRNVKSANILLDTDFNSKLTDFGLATDFDSHTEMDVIYGISEYIAPEYTRDGKVSEKIDVYAFGFTLLEIFSGLHAAHLNKKVQQLMSQEINTALLPLKKFIISSISDLKNLDNLMDPRLDGGCPLKVARLAIQLVVSCIDDDPNERPSMKEAIQLIKQIQTIIKMPSIASTSSKMKEAIKFVEPIQTIIEMPSVASTSGQNIFDDHWPFDINLDSRRMVSESAYFDSEIELSFRKSETVDTPNDIDLVSEAMGSEPAYFDPQAELSIPKLKTSWFSMFPEAELSIPKLKTSWFSIF